MVTETPCSSAEHFLCMLNLRSGPLDVSTPYRLSCIFPVASPLLMNLNTLITVPVGIDTFDFTRAVVTGIISSHGLKLWRTCFYIKDCMQVPAMYRSRKFLRGWGIQGLFKAILLCEFNKFDFSGGWGGEGCLDPLYIFMCQQWISWSPRAPQKANWTESDGQHTLY